MMRRLAFSVAAIASTAAFAQSSDPALDDILSPDQPHTELDELGARSGPSELDELSQGSPDGDFPDIETVDKRKPVSVTLRALDKIIAKYADIVIPMSESATFGTLTITARTCDKRPPEEFPETTAFVEIVDSTPAPTSNLKIPEPKKRSDKVRSEPAASASASPPAPAPAVASGGHAGAVSPAAPARAALPENMIFSGWMFASSPALSSLEHPVYDVWVIDCKTVKVGS
jgi:hypothetical protein